MSKRKSNRREEILGTLTQMLANPGAKPITTARLADAVGVSEAALYRHFPSKARMYDELIDYIEAILLSGINQILEQEKETMARLRQLVALVLQFAEQSPGMTRVLTGEALQGEHERLRSRIAQLFERLESQVRHILKERRLREGVRFEASEAMLANVIMAYVEGKLSQFARSDFKQLPTQQFADQWELLERQLLAA